MCAAAQAQSLVSLPLLMQLPRLIYSPIARVKRARILCRGAKISVHRLGNTATSH